MMGQNECAMFKQKFRFEFNVQVCLRDIFMFTNLIVSALTKAFTYCCISTDADMLKFMGDIFRSFLNYRIAL